MLGYVVLIQCSQDVQCQPRCCIMWKAPISLCQLLREISMAVIPWCDGAPVMFMFRLPNSVIVFHQSTQQICLCSVREEPDISLSHLDLFTKSPSTTNDHGKSNTSNKCHPDETERTSYFKTIGCSYCLMWAWELYRQSSKSCYQSFRKISVLIPLC